MDHRRQLENELRRWLRSHYSIIGWSEALQLGAPRSLILQKAQRGEWVREYLGVYRDTAGPESPYQALRAAFVATAGQGVVSHASAAWLWQMLPNPPGRPEVTIGAVSNAARKLPGLTVHRSRDLAASEAAFRHTMLVTNPLRTLVDLAGTVLPPTLTTAVDAALASKLVTVAGVEAEIGRLARRGRPGVGAMRRHLAAQGFVGAPNPSVLEARMRRLVASLGRRGVPLPSVEVRAGPEGEYRVDVAWAAVWFAVEVDGYAWHSSPAQAGRDHDRRNRLQRLGWTILVYTWADVANESARLEREIAATYQRCQQAACARQR